MAVAPLLPFTPSFWITLAGYIGLASLVAIGLVLLTGVGGMTSFGQAAFVGFGAYATAVLTDQVRRLALGDAAGLARRHRARRACHRARHGQALRPLPAARHHRLGRSALSYLFGNLAVLGGYDGISGIPPFAIGPFELIDARAVYYLIWLAVLIAVVAEQQPARQPHGPRHPGAARRRRLAPNRFGVDTAQAKLVVFVYAGLLAGLSGWLYAHVQRSVSPSPFGLSAGIEYLLMAVLGGSGAVLGGVVGAGVVAVLNDQLQNWLPKLMEGGGNLDTIVFGVVLVAAAPVRPRGALAGAAPPRARAGAEGDRPLRAAPAEAARGQRAKRARRCSRSRASASGSAAWSRSTTSAFRCAAARSSA